VVQGDALRAVLADLGPSPRRIVANLPYNVSTALLVRWLHEADDVADMVLMFQKEVADRLVALPRSKDYGRLSVLAQHVCTVQRLFDVAPSAFVPPPKVTSSIVRLRPRPADRRLADLGPLERVTAAAFGQRRKMPARRPWQRFRRSHSGSDEAGPVAHRAGGGIDGDGFRAPDWSYFSGECL
jgi:16S rRNA (adenine1518-N6/adenine1519-N6)-dimethyltransferase